MSNNKGFTLVEVVVAVVIISIISIVATVAVLGSINNSRDESYKIMVKNIKTAAISLYEEVYANELLDSNVELYKYDTNGRTDEEILIEDNKISINLQTLVSNGFLNGSNNDECGIGEANCNFKLIKNPKIKGNPDIGSCMITIIKTFYNNKVSYEIVSDNDIKKDGESLCPTSDDYKE